MGHLARESSDTEADAPQLWKRGSPLVDMGDTKLRLRALTLVQACTDDAEKALAIYNFVRRLPICAGAKLRLRTPREVLQRGRGDAVDKATLLVALLRLAGLPARMRFAAARREVLRGLVMDVCGMPRPYVEVFTGGRWVCTDTYIFDSGYLSAARRRLREEREQCGYGIHAEGATLWESHRDAYLLGPDGAEEVIAASGRAWRDPLDFLRSLSPLQRLGLRLKMLAWNLAAPLLDGKLRAMRLEAERRRRRREQRGRSASSAGRRVRAGGAPRVAAASATMWP